MGVVAMVAFATIFSTAGLLMVALSFSTDHWIEYTFARSTVQKSVDDGTAPNPASLNVSLQTNPLMFTRYRGLFRTCYPGRDTYFLDSLPDVIEGHCLPEMGYELIRPLESTANYPPEYTTRKHLMRTHFALFVCAMLTFLIGVFSGTIGCWKLSKRALLVAGIVLFVGAFFTAGGMSIFHGYEFLEKQVINLDFFPKGWASVIATHTHIEYGWSYIVGWLGMAVGVVAAMLYLCAAYSVVVDRPVEKRPLDDYHVKSARYLDGSVDHYPPQMVRPHYAYPAMANDYGGYRY